MRNQYPKFELIKMDHSSQKRTKIKYHSLNRNPSHYTHSPQLMTSDKSDKPLRKTSLTQFQTLTSQASLQNIETQQVYHQVCYVLVCTHFSCSKCLVHYYGDLSIYPTSMGHQFKSQGTYSQFV